MSTFNVHVTRGTVANVSRRSMRIPLRCPANALPSARARFFFWTNFHQPGECVDHIWIYMDLWVLHVDNIDDIDVLIIIDL